MCIDILSTGSHFLNCSMLVACFCLNSHKKVWSFFRRYCGPPSQPPHAGKQIDGRCSFYYIDCIPQPHHKKTILIHLNTLNTKFQYSLFSTFFLAQIIFSPTVLIYSIYYGLYKNTCHTKQSIMDSLVRI